MNLARFRVIATSDHNFGVRQPNCAYRMLENCVAANHRWCRDAHSLRTAIGTARVYATYSGLNHKNGSIK